MSGITLMVLGSGGSLPLPVNSVAPVVSGTAQSGQTLSSTTGTWVGVVDNYSYQWQRGAGASYSNISGATSSTYTVTSGDAGYLLRCQVRATNVTGTSDPASSNATALVPGQVVLSGSGGTQNWVVPPAVTSVSYMLVGRGGRTNSIGNQVTPGRGGGGGATVYSNNASVSGGSTLTVNFAFNSARGSDYQGTYFNGAFAEGGNRAGSNSTGGNSTYCYGGTANTAGNGGANGTGSGAGAAGYSGNGGNGGGQNSAGSSGSGGAGGGAGGSSPYSTRTGAGGGGVGLLGAGANGAGGAGSQPGGGGSGGGSGGAISTFVGGDGGAYGGGGGGGGAGYDYDPNPGSAGSGGNGAVRIMWGTNRSYPSTNTADQ